MATVTFVVTNYNYGRYLQRSVESLLAQSFRKLNLIIVDDCSTDDSGAVLERYANEPRVTVVRHSANVGAIPSWNEGLMLADGDYIGILDADDCFARADAVERMVAAIASDPEVGFVYSACQFIDAAGRPLPAQGALRLGPQVVAGHDEFKRLMWEHDIPHSGTLVRRACHEAIGWYDARYPHGADYDLWLRLCTRYKVAYVAERLSSYRVHDANMSHAAISPGQAIDEIVAILDRNLELLTAAGGSVTDEFAAAARTHGLFVHLWIDLGWGRVGRSWRGLFAIARRSPATVLRRVYLSSLLRTACLSALGGARYRRLFGGFAG
jgi:GT2 family glycosyltransferase